MTKTYTPAGLVVFADVCTKESASASVDSRADATQKLAAGQGNRLPALALIFTLGQPLLFLHSFSELTELPFALVISQDSPIEQNGPSDSIRLPTTCNTRPRQRRVEPLSRRSK